MRTQRGDTLVTLLVYAVAAAAALGLVYGAYEWVNHSWATDAGIKQGTEAENKRLTAMYEERDRKAKEKYDSEIAALRDRYTKLEAANLTLQQANAALYQKGLADGKADVDRRVAAVRAGFRLRDASGTTQCPTAGEPSRSTTSTPGTSGRSTDAASGSGLPTEAGCTLSERVSEGLIRLAGDGDDAARQVNGLIAEVKRIYDICTK